MGMYYVSGILYSSDELYHYGVIGQKWGEKKKRKRQSLNESSNVLSSKHNVNLQSAYNSRNGNSSDTSSSQNAKSRMERQYREGESYARKISSSNKQKVSSIENRVRQNESIIKKLLSQLVRIK